MPATVVNVLVNFLVVLLLAMGAGRAAAQDTAAPGEYAIDNDFESRVDYAFFTENSNTLRNLVANASAAIQKGGASPALNYQLAYAHFRRAGLLQEKELSAAGAELAKCADALDAATEGATGFAEAYALQSMCLGRLAAVRSFSAMVNGPLSSARLARAKELAPRNPRVVLADGMADYWKPRAFGGDKAGAVAKLRAAIDLFERYDEQPGSPRWGLVDAWMTLGMYFRDEEDPLAARNAFERALLVAPEYAAARRALAEVTRAR
jgi:hypothetical protein